MMGGRDVLIVALFAFPFAAIAVAYRVCAAIVMRSPPAPVDDARPIIRLVVRLAAVALALLVACGMLMVERVWQ